EAASPARASSPGADARTPEPVARAVVGGQNGGSRTSAVAAPQPVSQTLSEENGLAIASLAALEDALIQAGQLQLAGEVFYDVHLVRLEEGRLEFRPREGARGDLSADLTRALHSLTGRRWIVSIVGSGGEPTLAERKK